MENLNQRNAKCQVHFSLLLLQENEKSPSQNKKTKDATSDTGKGECEEDCWLWYIFDGSYSQIWYSTLFCCTNLPCLLCCLTADGLAYSALLKNELLGAGIEKVMDPQTEDRRLQPSTPERRSLFSVSLSYPLSSFDATYTVLRCHGNIPAEDNEEDCSLCQVHSKQLHNDTHE